MMEPNAKQNTKPNADKCQLCGRPWLSWASLERARRLLRWLLR
jgi:hypothetical protein